MPLSTRVPIITVLLLVVTSFSFTGALAHHKVVTFTVDIVPAKSATSLAPWGKVKSELGTCTMLACPNRVPAGKTYVLTETPNRPKKHPFLYWTLPNGSKVKASHVSVKVTSDSRVVAEFKG